MKDPTTHFHLSREPNQCTNFLSQEDNIGYFHVKNQFPQLRPHPSPSCLLSYQRLQNEDEVIISNSKFSTLSYIYPSRASLTKVIEPSPCVKCPVPALPTVSPLKRPTISPETAWNNTSHHTAEILNSLLKVEFIRITQISIFAFC